MLPMLAKELPTTVRPRLRHLRFTSFSFALGIPVALGLLLFGHFVLDLLFGPAFSPALGTLRIMALLVPLIFANTYLTNYLIARQLQKLLPVTSVFSLILTVVFCLLFIPALGFPGTAVARVCAEIGNLLFMFMLSTVFTRTGTA
jgi:PST family polysaccharide transporter